MTTDILVTRLGIDPDDATALARISRTLQRWAEAECGDSTLIERDEDTGIPHRVIWPHRSERPTRYRIPDRETGALKRLGRIMARYPHLVAYHQTDPRGAAVYVLRRDDLGTDPIDRCYTRGVAV
jgi:hypothetical protein